MYYSKFVLDNCLFHLVGLDRVEQLSLGGRVISRYILKDLISSYQLGSYNHPVGQLFVGSPKFQTPSAGLHAQI